MRLQCFADRPVAVRIVDLLGRAVAEQHLVPTAALVEAALAVPTLTPAGVYLVTVSDGARTWTTRWSREP